MMNSTHGGTGEQPDIDSGFSRELAGLSAAAFFDASPVATFVINREHVVTHFNRACAATLGLPACEAIGSKGLLGRIFYGHERPVLADLIVDGEFEALLEKHYKNGKYRASPLIAGAYEAEGFFPHMGEHGRWLYFTAAPLRDSVGAIIGAIETLQDISERKQAEAALEAAHAGLAQQVQVQTAELAQTNETLQAEVRRMEKAQRKVAQRNGELSELNAKLSAVQDHLVQNEKLASIGQLAAGVAHEINNPIGYIFSNFGSLEKYLASLFEMLAAYEEEEGAYGAQSVTARIRALRERIDVAFLKEDIPVLMRESREGISRVRKIVQDLKDFSHVEATQDWLWSDITQGIDSTLNIVSNEVKYKADVVRDYAELPAVQCLPSQINQVVMNLVVNAAHAIGEQRGTITIRTGVQDDSVWIEVEDNGSGIPKESLARIFDPFYTTKPVGKGTGLGLSLSYGIVHKHRGSIDVRTELGKGTCFRVNLPITQPAEPVAAAGTNS